ncbi:hypothetical protein [Massilia sp. METH4]|uniref:hypothetical protein n=1 Tax=Massilia sp. METH4 TaxID=3123041 RepID=UPI0030D0F05C
MMDQSRRAVDNPEENTVEARADRLRAEQVEVGLVMQEMLGTSVAAHYLCQNDIRTEVALRVLTRPWQRRWRALANISAAESAEVIAGKL